MEKRLSQYGKRLVYHGIAKDANKDKGKGLLTL